jgi:hypothetical protein
MVFEEWSKDEGTVPAITYKAVAIRGGRVYAGNTPLIFFADDLSPEGQAYYEQLLLAGAQVKEENEAVGG